MTEKRQNQDTLQRFIFEKHHVRGVIVHLNASFKAALAHRQYNLTIRKLLGETLSAAALLASTIKFKGKLSLQLQGDGPLKLLLAQINDSLQLRCLAMTRESVRGGFARVMGKGHLLMNISQDNSTDHYQAVTQLEGKSIADTLAHYFEQSEQLATRFWLFSNKDEAVGLLLQCMPGEPKGSLFWEHVNVLAQTITAKELLSLPNHTILHRLFHQEDVRIFEEEMISFRCNCSVEKMETALLQLGKQDAEELIKEEGNVKINCDFCNRDYVFDAVDVAHLFAKGHRIDDAPSHKQ